MYVYDKSSAKSPKVNVGNQQLLRQWEESKACSERSGNPVVQRLVEGDGELQTQYYLQNPTGDLEYTDDAAARDEHEGPSTFEEGYQTFTSDVKANKYSSVFLTEIEHEGKYHYLKTLLPPKLPVSCIESAAWAMHLMDVNSLVGADYPEYKMFDDWVYEFDKEGLEPCWRDIEAGRSGSVPILQQAMERFGGVHTDFMSVFKEYIARKTSVKVVGKNRVLRDVDSESLDNDMAGKAAYTGTYDVGDGILIASKSNEAAANFHAVAIVATFPEGEMIVLERNAGHTQISEGQTGDTNWLMNVYESASDFLVKAEVEASPHYKIFKLKIQ